MIAAELPLLARTVAHLRPAQVASRIRLRVQQAALRQWPRLAERAFAGPGMTAGGAGLESHVASRAVRGSWPGWPAGFVPLDARLAEVPGYWPGLAELREGRISLLGVERSLGEPLGWEHADAPRLWRFHLHYWDWAHGLAAEPDRAEARAVFGGLWNSWQRSVQFGAGDAWLPYPAALRAWSWCGLHRDQVAGTGIEDQFARSLALHAGYLRHNLETDAGGNHLIKNLKALIGLAVFSGDERLLARSLRRINRELAIQVLPDGGHFERAPAYHCQVLGDLIDLAGLLARAGRAPGGELTGAITRMRDWLGQVLLPDGSVPMLNDGYPVPSAVLRALAPGTAPAGPLALLAQTGLARAVAGDWHLLADVGPACPDGLPAHAHADTLGCLVQVGGGPMLVDTGTSTYAPGADRAYERSTAAHSTAEIGGGDSTEVWGTFRAGRRARVFGVRATAQVGTVTIEAAHDGYRRLPGHPVHHRRWTLTDRELRIDDTISGSGRQEAVVRWQLAPGAGIELRQDGASVTVGDRRIEMTVAGTAPFHMDLEIGRIAAGFGRTAPAPVLACRVDAALPVRIGTSWRLPEAGGNT